MGLNRSLGEDVGFALELLFFVQLLQRTEKIVGVVILECQRIGAAVDETVFFGESIVKPAQFRLCLPDLFIRRHSVHLQINERMQAIAQLHHAFDALCGGDAQRRLAHQAVLTVVDLAIYHGVAVIAHVRVCGNAVRQRLVLAQIRELRRLIGAANGLYRFMQLVA